MVNSKLSYYAGTLLFWIVIIFSVLYVPRFFNLLHHQKSINVFLWSGVIDTKLIDDFTKKTGIKVLVNYFQTNDELMVKVLATKGSGYDLIMPSDYAVSFFAENGLLKKIDKTKLDFWDKINPHFLHHSFDPENTYSIPAEWYILGIGVNTNHFKNTGIIIKPSWETIFKPYFSTQYRIGLLNDNREMACLAAKYLFKTLRPITDSETLCIQDLLIHQKKWVEAYTDFRGDFLLESGNCSLVLVPINAVWKTIIKNPAIDFLIPEEGTFLGIENFAILESSTKADLVYQFINYLFTLEVQRHNFYHRMSLSTRSDADFIQEVPLLKECLARIATSENSGAFVFQNVLTNDQVNDLCMTVKGY